jgi:sulfur-oxidizing protein SoxY
MLGATISGSLGLVLPPVAARASGGQGDLEAENELVRKLTGKSPELSSRVRLDMPAVFGNGYGVPMSLAVESPMTAADYVKRVHVFAPRNPIIPVASFQFSPKSGRAAIVTRIRLAEPQNVIAVAETSGGAWLMNRAWVQVETNGCL